MTTAAYIVSGLALIVVVFGGSQLAGPYFGKYKITDSSIEFVMFGKLRVWRSSFEDITEIQLVSFARSMILPSLHLMNRPFGQFVLVRRRRGMFKAVLISPDQPQEFVRIVRQKIGG